MYLKHPFQDKKKFKVKKTWSKMALNGLKCILIATYFFWKKVWKMKMTQSNTPPPSVEFSIFLWVPFALRISTLKGRINCRRYRPLSKSNAVVGYPYVNVTW